MKNKLKIVVYGGSGFVGSHVVDELVRRGFAVTVFDKKRTKHINKHAKFVTGDVLDKAAVKKALRGAHAVYNFAGIMDIKYCHDHPEEALAANILGNANILDAAAKEKVRLYVYASSLYVNTDRGSFYRISKYASELAVQEFKRLFDLDYVILRYGSLYGPRSDERNGMYRFIENALNKEEVVHFGTKNDQREFIHIFDAARISVDILEDRHKNKIYLVTGPENVGVVDVIKKISKHTGKKVAVKVKPSIHQLNYGHTAYTYSFKEGEIFKDKNLTRIKDALPELIEIVQMNKKAK